MNEQVAAMVRRELAKNPEVGNDVRREKALGLDRGVRRLSPRQFHATYRLPALRSVAATGRTATAKTAPSGRAERATTPTTKAAAPASRSPAPSPDGRAREGGGGTPAGPNSATTAPPARHDTRRGEPTPAARTADEPSAAAPGTPAPGTPAPGTPAPGTPARRTAAADMEARQPSTSRALTRPHAAEREAVRGILQLVAREALATEDRAAFVRLLDSLDERASVILGLFGRVQPA